MDGTGLVFLECAGVCLTAVFLALLLRLIRIRRRPSRTADSRANISTQTARRHQHPHDGVVGCPHGKKKVSVTSPPQRRSDRSRCDPPADLSVSRHGGKRNALEDQDADFSRCPQEGMDAPDLPKVYEIRPRRLAATAAWGMLAHLLLQDSYDNCSIASLSLFGAWKEERKEKRRKARKERRLWRLKSKIQREEILESEMLELGGCAGASSLHTI